MKFKTFEQELPEVGRWVMFESVITHINSYEGETTRSLLRLGLVQRMFESCPLTIYFGIMDYDYVEKGADSSGKQCLFEEYKGARWAYVEVQE